MVNKKNRNLFTRLVLYCTIMAFIASTEPIYAISFAPIIKKIAKVGAIVGGIYWGIREFLNYSQPRCHIRIYQAFDPATVGTHQNKPGHEGPLLRVITDAKVTVRPKQANTDNTIKITHNYSSSWRSDLQQIDFSDTYDPENKTITVQGLLRECHTGKIQRFIQWLFHLKQQITLHHIIEVPLSTNIEISTGNSERYTYGREEPVVHIDSRLNHVLVHANTGDVSIENQEQQAKLTVSHLRDRSDPAKKPGDDSLTYKVDWEKESQKTSAGKIEIHTPGNVTVKQFTGNLKIFGAQKLEIERHPQNYCGKVKYNGITQPYLLAYPPTEKQLQHWLLRSHDDSQNTLENIWTPEQLQQFQQYHWTDEQIQLWTHEQLRHWTPDQLRHWTPEHLGLWAQCWNTEQAEYQIIEEIQQRLAEQLQNRTAEQRELWTKRWPGEQFENWTPEQFEHMAPEQLEHMKTQHLELWTDEQLHHWLPEQHLRQMPAEQFKYWIPEPFQQKTNGWENDQMDRWIPESLQSWNR